MLSAENFIFIDFFAVKVDGSDVNPGIYMKTSFVFTDCWVDVTSGNFNSEKVNEDEIFGRQDILQFFSGEFKDYKYVKFPRTLGALFKNLMFERIFKKFHWDTMNRCIIQYMSG